MRRPLPKALKMLCVSTMLLSIKLTCLAQSIPGDRRPIPGAEEIYLEELNASKPGVDRIEALLTLSTYYGYSSHLEPQDFHKEKSYGYQALRLSTTLNYQDGINEARVLIADSYIYLGQDSLGQLMLDSALADITKVRKQSKLLSQPEREIRALRQLAIIYELQEKYDLAEDALLEIIKVIQFFGFSNAHYTYGRLSMLNFDQKKWDKSLLYGLEALKSMKTTGDTVSAGFFYGNLGMVYVRVGEFQKSLDYTNAALNFFKDYNSTYLFQLFDYKTGAMLKMKKYDEVIVETKRFSKKYPPSTFYESRKLEQILADTYRSLKQYELAEPHYLRVFEIQRQESSFTRNGYYKSMGQFYAEWGKFEKARPFLENALKLMKGNAHLHYLMYMTDSAQGNYQSAMRHLLENKKLDDSTYYATKTRAIQEMQVKYDTDMKERDLALLKQESQLQQAKLQQASTTQNMFIGGAVMLMLLLLLLYNRYQLKQRVNEEIGKKNRTLEHLVEEKEWLLKEVHHRVKNNLQTVLSLLESQSRKLSNEALDAIQESQNRVYAMSLIHKKLYQSTDVSSINAKDYLRDLVENLRDSFGCSRTISFSLQLNDVVLDVSQAVPLGLIVNEAVTNAIKYAFPIRKQDNEIGISLSQTDADKVILCIKDNGDGISSPKENLQSLGLKLMRGLTEDIDGTFSIESNRGVTILVEFVANVPFQKIAELEIVHY